MLLHLQKGIYKVILNYKLHLNYQSPNNPVVYSTLGVFFCRLLCLCIFDLHFILFDNSKYLNSKILNVVSMELSDSTDDLGVAYTVSYGIDTLATIFNIKGITLVKFYVKPNNWSTFGCTCKYSQGLSWCLRQ